MDDLKNYIKQRISLAKDIHKFLEKMVELKSDTDLIDKTLAFHDSLIRDVLPYKDMIHQYYDFRTYKRLLDYFNEMKQEEETIN